MSADSLLTAAGWTPAGGDLWSHPCYGTRSRETALLVASRKQEKRPTRARRCGCRFPLVDRDTATGMRCVLCGRAAA
jgi:hypothetical protein